MIETLPNQELIKQYPFVLEEAELQAQISFMEECGYYNFETQEIKDAIYENLALGFYEQAKKDKIPTTFTYVEQGGPIKWLGRIVTGRPVVYRGWMLGETRRTEPYYPSETKNIVLSNGQLYQHLTVHYESETGDEVTETSFFRCDDNEYCYHGWLGSHDKQSVYEEIRLLEQTAINILEGKS